MKVDEFLLARIAEDEAAARDAFYEGQRWISEDESLWRWPADEAVGWDPARKRDARHIVRWDPARVLRECEAKRRMVDAVIQLEAVIDWEWGCGHTADQIRRDECDDVPIDGIRGLRILAAVYSDHPDYDPAWVIDSDTHGGWAKG